MIHNPLGYNFLQLIFSWWYKRIWKGFEIFIRYVWGWFNIHQPEVINWFSGILKKLPLSLKIITTWIISKSPLIIADIFDADICYIVLIVFYLSSFEIIFYEIFFSWWFDWILSNRSSWMKKYSLSDIGPVGSSGIPIKSQKYFLSNWSYPWSIINIPLTSS